MELERIVLPPPGPLHLPLALLELGCAGRCELLPGPAPPRSTLPQGLPPFTPPLTAELEQCFLGTPAWLPPHQHERAQRCWTRVPTPRALFVLEPTPVHSSVRALRDPGTGALQGFVEELHEDSGLASSPDVSSIPQWEGGLEEPPLELLHTQGPNEEDLDLENDLLTTPPGLKRGVEFQPRAPGARGGAPSLCSVLGALDSLELGGAEEEEKKEGEGAGGGTPSQPPPDKGGAPSPTPPLRRADSLEELVMGEVLVPPTTATPSVPPQSEEEEWAVEEDCSVPVEDFEEKIPDPAFKWPFRPDAFQQRAALCLERGQSLLVAAHTSAGKTAVAEYAIALARRHMTRAIYTSPIKALSNQKFRDFRATFGDVGLLTGDVQLRTDASCLIMTTEILRSMLYNGSEVLRELEWVIFDEVHYINDAERGVVWEETLILLPEHVGLVLLSATIPNALEFAQWVGRTKRRCLRVLSTRQRPVPLEHFLYTGGGGPPSPRDLFLLLDARGGFNTQGYYAAVEAQKQRASKHTQSFGAKQPHGGGSGPGQDRAMWHSLVALLQAQGQLPAVAFTFSRGRCDAHAAALGRTDLSSAAEKGRVRGFVRRCLARLRGGDRRLPQVLQMSELLERGIGVHHSGVLPLLKEVVEMLFSQGLVKLLFATETFAMGVNMPARTVIFDSIRKHDGNNFRDLLPGEYVQMSGRAGRRGLDRTGTVIILCRGTVPDMADLHRVMLGRPSGLQSQFRLTYGTILSLQRAAALTVEGLMRNSFGEFPLRRRAAAQQRRVAELQQELKALGEPPQEGTLDDLPQYYEAVQGLLEARAELQRRVAQSVAGLKALAPGRVVVVCTPQHHNALGLILQVTAESGGGRTITTMVLSEKPTEEGGPPPSPPPDAPYPEDILLSRLFLPEGPPGAALEQLHPEDLGGIVGRTLRANPPRLLEELRRRQTARGRKDPPSPELLSALQELLRMAGGAPGGLPLLDPVGALQLRDPPAVEAAARARSLGAALGGFRCVHGPRFPQLYSQFAARRRLQAQVEQLQYELSDRSLLLLPEYRQRLGVLRALGYVADGGAVQLPGRVAALLSCHELLLTELLLGNVLSPLRPEEVAALLSCTVHPGRGEPPPKLPPNLQRGMEQIRAVAERVGRLQEEWGLPQSAEDYVGQFGFGLAEVVYEWARGMPFAALAALAPLQEGAVVRCIQRLEELCRELRRAARMLGDPGLAATMEAASGCIKRDIVFAASLYIQ
ncbi:helicase SKI2W [Gallus gallus]|uniref:helicase SKI2W n=1 Tax=Gallus gallus TaxID=9031 RepID=UPI001AEA64EB|nr:helicase SKI2W [Gallus gallus]